jgi:hypothetical protein
LLGDNGIITRAQNASDETKTALVQEDIELAWSGRIAAYYDAYANDSSVARASYFSEEEMNKELAEGTISDYSYEEEDTTFVYTKNSTGEKYGVSIDESGKVSISEIYIKIKNLDGETKVITPNNLGKYLGKAVKYKPSNLSTNTDYGTSSIYRIFYIDFTGKYGDGEGTIYLKADCDDKNKALTILPTDSSSDSYAVMQKLNPSWVKAALLQDNDTYVSRILDPNNWTAWKDKTTEGIGEDNINYVVGSPSLEMYVDSYNAYLDSHSGLYVNGSTTTLAEKLACEYVTSGYGAKGYRIGFLSVASSSWDNTGYYPNENSLISSSEANGMYNPGSGKYYWLASPSAFISDRVMGVDGNLSLVGTRNYSSYVAFCPLVSLKSGVKLELKN